MAAVLGEDQPWIRLTDRAMKAMLAPLGIRRIQVDPGQVLGCVPILLPA
jgi:hypothetical protein